jgi:adenosine deaminase
MTHIYGNTTVPAELNNRLRDMPKVELHVHLEGATDAATVWELAQRNKVSLPAATLEEWKSMYAFRDFDHFIDIYSLATACMQTPYDFSLLTDRFIAHLAQHNIKYCEAFLSASPTVAKISMARDCVSFLISHAMSPKHGIVC